MKKDMQDMLQRIRTDYIFGKIPFLSCLSDAEIAEFKGLIVEKQFLKNQIILHEEDTSNYLYFIFTGKAKVVQINADGKERMLTIHKKGDFFGEMAILDGRTAPATVIALENARIGLISRDAFRLHLLKNNKVLNEIITMLCGRLRDAWTMTKVMSFADAEHRVRAVLKYMAQQFGVPGPEGTRIDIKLTHTDIGSFASLTRETVTRMLNRLIKTREIEVIDRKYILLKPAFQNNDSL
jgi:CRP/FNR family transcriptional regulator